jgi:predicted nucleic acid-binding Zn ribbon protein
MPIYIYEHPETGEHIEVLQSMKEEHTYKDEEGVEWRRVFLSSELNTTGNIDPWNKNDFMNKTAGDSGSMGDLMDRSKDLSEMRAQQNGGVDPVQQKYFEDYKKRRGGKAHPSQKKKTIENKNFKIDFD